ncbi:uncharacterized protein LOC121467064 [Drosophila elegans]|uniref:uncharacterized protein LOC108141757 n=1 Tax=Drosophila elegans TaxID=30023 RepID=UPI0007E870F2|nr:uncharacterized protein LOC108141757 [Drosophila elegans]XP_041563832.1 uncharacterized protein LOC121467064 [Drosophila elegans]
MERESPKKLEDALEEMGMQGVLPYLQEAGVTLSLLESVTEEELKEAVLQLGLRMLFKRKLTIWREKNKITKVSAGQNENETTFVLHKSIRSIIEAKEHGKTLINKRNLVQVDRIWLISAIVEEAINNNLIIC